MTNRSNVSMFHIMYLAAIFVTEYNDFSDYKATAYKILDKIAKLQVIVYCKFTILQVLLLIAHF